MSLRTLAAAGFTAAVAALVFPSSVAACSCVVDTNRTPALVRKAVQDELNGSAMVFVGEVVSADQFEAVLQVKTAWRDKTPEMVRMLHARRNPDGTVSFEICQYSFRAGTQYLVFATGAPDGLRAFHCGFTAPHADAAATVRILDELVKRDAISVVPPFQAFRLSGFQAFRLSGF